MVYSVVLFFSSIFPTHEILLLRKYRSFIFKCKCIDRYRYQGHWSVEAMTCIKNSSNRKCIIKTRVIKLNFITWVIYTTRMKSMCICICIYKINIYLVMMSELRCKRQGRGVYAEAWPYWSYRMKQSYHAYRVIIPITFIKISPFMVCDTIRVDSDVFF